MDDFSLLNIRDAYSNQKYNLNDNRTIEGRIDILYW